MTNIIIINSTLGCGKSTVAKLLSDKYEDSFLINGDDYSRRVDGFSVYDNDKIINALELIKNEIQKKIINGIKHIIVDYVFETPEHLDYLVLELESSSVVNTFYLKANIENIEQRIIARSNPGIEWELSRTKVILKVQSEYINSEKLGAIVNTDGKASNIVADYIHDIMIK